MDSCEWSDWSDEELSTFDNLEENACNTSEANSRKQVNLMSAKLVFTKPL